MKRLFKGLSVIILLSALVGAGILVKENQETRRGATMAETSMSVLPDSLKVEKGKDFTLTVWANTGKTEDKMAGAELSVRFDSKVMSYVSAEIQSEHVLLDEGSEGGGDRWFKIVAMGEEKSGAFPLLKINFKSLADGTDSVFVSPGAEMMITGQSSLWTVAKAFSSKVVVGEGGTTTALNCGWCGNSCIDVNPKMMCPKIAPPRGQSCVNVDQKCVIKKSQAGEGEMCGGISGIMCAAGLVCNYKAPSVDTSRATTPDMSGTCVKENLVKPTPTSATGLSCGQRCGGSIGCGAGLTCMPIWWPCEVTIPESILKRITANAELDKATVVEMLRVCPAAQKVLVSSGVIDAGGVTKELTKMPPFYGVCRNASCVDRKDCNCDVATPTPIVTVKNDAKMGLYLPKKNVSVGEETTLQQWVEVGATGKISAVSTRIKYDVNAFTVGNMEFEGRGTVLKKEVDTSKGLITIYYTWNLSADRLFNRYTLVNIKLIPKVSGSFAIVLDPDFKHEVSGLDGAGNPVGFAVGSMESELLIVADVAKCQVCAGGLAKRAGNANCDSVVNSLDFEIWRNEMFDKGGLGGVKLNTWKSDFNCDQMVSGIDFEIWRKTVFQ